MPSQANEDPNEVKARSQKCERTEHLSFHISANVANLWNDRFRPSEILLSRYTEDSSSAVHDPDGTPYPSMVESPKKPSVPAVKVEMKEESDDSDVGSDIENSYKEDLERRRKENLKLNAEFFAKLGINEAKLSLLETKIKRKSATNRGLKREKVPAEILPRRSSLRLQNKDPDGLDLPPEALIARAARFAVYEEPVSHDRPPAGPLQMSEYLYSTSTEKDHGCVVKLLPKLDTKPYKPQTTDLDSYIKQTSKFHMTERRVAKVVPNRTFSVAIHPTVEKVLVATGGKWGKLGLWDVVPEKNSESDGVCCYTPHSRPIVCVDFPVTEPYKMYSCSYDGSLRCGDLQNEIFDEIYSVPEEDDVLLRNFSFTTPSTMLVSQSNGRVVVVDTRTPGCEAEQSFQLHERSLRTVSVHPTQTQYFVTGGTDGMMTVWDLRNCKEKKSKSIAVLPHGKSINSAYFSPVTGKYILSTSMDDRITVFDSSSVGSCVTVKRSISHNNHTGRWLTNFRASWHPAREDVFVVGSMNRPREITLFSDDGKKLHSFKDEDWLGSVCSLNAIHPTLNYVVGANSSGRLHVFMGR